MKTRLEIKSVFGKVLFSYECEENTIKKTLEQAVKSNANLRNANLSNADLRNANLSNANLSKANLFKANLFNADLSNADLSKANLSKAKNKETSFLPIYCKWSFSIKGNEIQIGCKSKTIEEWGDWFSSNEAYSTTRNTEDFKQIEAVYNALKSYYITLNS